MSEYEALRGRYHRDLAGQTPEERLRANQERLTILQSMKRGGNVRLAAIRITVERIGHLERMREKTVESVTPG